MGNQLCRVIASTPEQRFAEIVAYFRGKTGVTLPSEEPGQRKSFGSSGLKVKGRVFAMLSSDREFVVKLPERELML